MVNDNITAAVCGGEAQAAAVTCGTITGTMLPWLMCFGT